MFPLSELEAHYEMDGKIKLLMSHPFVSDIIVGGLRAQQEEILSLAPCFCTSLKDSDAEKGFD